jgi:hypothetical protein
MRARRRVSNLISRRRVLAIAIGLGALIALPAIGLAHIERASYWPDPAPDTGVTPPAGGAVPAVRSIDSALDSGQPGTTRVVCPQPLTADQKDELNAWLAANDGGDNTGGQTGGSQNSGGGGVAGQTGSSANSAQLDALRAKLAALRKKLKKAHGKKRKGLKKKIASLEQQIAQLEQQLLQSGTPTTRDAATSSEPEPGFVTDNPSIQALDGSIDDALANGYVLRPSQGPIDFTQQQADDLRMMNVRLLARCAYTEIQPAVTDSHNNDRVEVMPGVYTEPTSRAAPTNDPACADLKETNDKGETGAVSYRYQYHCPNDQNLIAVIGRLPATDPTTGEEIPPPQPPLEDRHNIPDNGPCIRCNLQIQGTGVKPDDVTVDGDPDTSIGDASPPGQDSTHYPKDVGIRADRADGFVLDNVKVRHVNEHDVYVTETDGYNLDNFKTDYAGEYGVLTFVGVHGLIQNCAAWGNGDSGLYPGAAFDQGKDAGGKQIYNNEVRDCDSFHNSLGYSGTDGNAVYIHDNDFYENAQGLSSDVFTAPGHPGFPQHGDLVEHNDFYSNNYNPYLPLCKEGESPGPDGPAQNCSDFTPSVPVPVGTGMWWAGGNDNIVKDNRFYDNWRRGTMLYAVPDQLVCGPGVGSVDPSQLAGCDPTKVPPSTSYGNQYFGNQMGVAPDGSKQPNGVDFWWDQFVGNTGNCWHDNTGVNGDRDSLTTVPQKFPVAGKSVPGFLPEDCSSSIGTGGPVQEAELLACFADITFDTSTCNWFTTPAKP